MHHLVCYIVVHCFFLLFLCSLLFLLLLHIGYELLVSRCFYILIWSTAFCILYVSQFCVESLGECFDATYTIMLFTCVQSTRNAIQKKKKIKCKLNDAIRCCLNLTPEWLLNSNNEICKRNWITQNNLLDCLFVCVL